MRKFVIPSVLNLCLLIFLPGFAPVIQAQSNDLVYLEYYIDTDPGEGNGIPVAFTQGTPVDLNFQVDVTGYDVGFHFLCFRSKDSEGNWSITNCMKIYVDEEPVSVIPTPIITYLEYFIDIDPGEGNGNSVPLGQGIIIDENFSVDVSGIDIGFHQICFRTKDNNGKWSLTNVFNIYVDEEPVVVLPDRNLIAGEFFIDTDPGYGNGTPFSINPAPLIDEIIQITDVSGLDAGEHYLHFRVMDESGKWSHNNYVKFFMLDLKAWLEGPYDSLVHQMSTVLNTNNLLPLNQPYSSQPGAAWYYNGAEHVSSIPATDIIDWILIETRDASTAANAGSGTVDERQAAFVKKDGGIVGLDGVSYPVFLETVNQKLFVVLYHRNHLGIMTASEVLQTGTGSYTYDFSTGPLQVYGGSLGHKKIETGVWGMASGDGDANGQVGNPDKNDVWSLQAGSLGYLAGDFSMDSQVNNTDKNDKWAPNSGKGSQIPH
ncbi:MAG: hypothetical protein JW861_13040 [Bacteroidales bacterium]|nr:hypothetical protein [Bacteroidales bacterium]